MSVLRARSSAVARWAGVLTLALSASASPLLAQNSFEEAIKQLNSEEVRGYTQPLADVLVANLSSAFFASSSPRSSFGLSIELAAMGTQINDKLRTFTANTPPGFQPATVQAPTIFGGKATPVEHSTISGLSYRTSDGILDADMVPTAVPQVRVSGLNTEIIGRYFDSGLLGDSYPQEDLPKLSMFGIGARHSLHQYFDNLPVEVAISASFNSMTFGDYAELTGSTFGANIGKRFGMLSVMGGIESAGGTMNLSYTSENQFAPGSVNIDLEAERQLRFNAGATLNFGFGRLFGTASLGNVTTFAGGLSLGL